MTASGSPARTTASGATRRRRPGPGWVPREHGAWAMLVVPVVVGAVVSGVTWRHGLLLGVWLLAYLAFQACALWLKASRRPRWWPPVRAYGLSALWPGLVLVAQAPALLRWAPVFGGLLAVSLLCAHRRADRSWLNDAVTVGAAMLMTVVAAGLGTHGTPHARGPVLDTWVPPGAGDPAAWAATAALAGYFLGTVPYVKTLLRERGDRRVLAVSIGYHAAVLVAALVVAVAAPRAGTVALAVVAAGLLVRAVVVPRRRPWPSAKAIGLGEVAATVVVTAAVLLAVA